MESVNILLAGLPATGKSTYITALWAIEKDGKSGHLLSCDGLPSESSYIDGMRDNWMVLKEVRRTSFAEPQEILLPMKNRRTDTKIDLTLPDFKGEVFLKILDNVVSEDISKWCDKTFGVLFMLNLGGCSPEMLQEQVSDTVMPRVELEKVVMTTDDITPAIKNVLLLKYLFNKIGDCPIAICFSQWDIVDCDDGINIDEWVRENHPCVYNFVTEHFSNYRYYGVSAQGADYGKLNEQQSDELAAKTTQKKRAYVYSSDKKSFDITEPIDFIISKINED
jgi:hypothetical protein